ncbi:MAG: penicillin-binding transpeptidase domain-containing protein [Planctomycetota bacterium]
MAARSLQLTFEKRLTVLFFGFVVAFGIGTLRLAQVQIAEADDHRKAVRSRRTLSILLPAPRGRILDRNGVELATSVETWDLRVYPVRFRERNRVDALGDLAMALLPERCRGLCDRKSQMKADVVEARLRRFLTIYEAREELLEALLKLPTQNCLPDIKALSRRWEPVLFPRGELVIPPNSRLRRRVLDALVILADDPALATRIRVQDRLERESVLGKALGIDVRSVVQGLDDEMAELGWLAEELDIESRDSFLNQLFAQEWRAGERLERKIMAAVDDHIALQRFGTHDLSKLDDDELEALAEDLRLPVDDSDLLWARLMSLRRARDDKRLPGSVEEGLLREFESVPDRRAFDRLPHARRRVLAFHLGLWSKRPDRLEREVGRLTRAKAGYNEADYLTFNKKWTRIQHFKGGIPYHLGSGLSFEVADRIWRTFGLRRAGFDIRASFGRRYPGEAEGLATMLLGRMTSKGAVIGGLEASLSRQVDLNDPNGALIDGTIVGWPGVVRRERQPDGSFRELETSRAPVAGDDVVLSLDSDLQRRSNAILARMDEALDGRLGSGAVVIDLATGDILCACSVPLIEGKGYFERYEDQIRLDRARRAFNEVKSDLSSQERDELSLRMQWEVEEVGFWSRAFEADSLWTPPGSVMKVFSAAALLESGTLNPNQLFHCWDKRRDLDLEGALYLSSNPYFWHHVKELGQKKLLSWFEAFGMFSGIDHSVSKSSARRRRAVVREHDAAKNSVIGQGSMSMSPVEIAAMMASFAGRGKSAQPRLVLSQGDQENPVRYRGHELVSSANWRLITRAMTRVAKHYAPALSTRYKIAGKTGTADGFGGRWRPFNQAWFAGFAPADRPRIAFAVTCVRTSKRGKDVAPFAAEIVKTVLDELR